MSEDSEEFTPEMVTDEMMKAYDFGCPSIAPEPRKKSDG